MTTTKIRSFQPNGYQETIKKGLSAIHSFNSGMSLARLSDCQWVTNGNNLIITGATGVGKTYLLSAFGREACTRGLP